MTSSKRYKQREVLKFSSGKIDSPQVDYAPKANVLAKGALSTHGHMGGQFKNDRIRNLIVNQHEQGLYRGPQV